MKWRLIYLFFIYGIQTYAQSPLVISHIDSLVADINRKKFTEQVLINDTVAMLSGYAEKEIKAYLDHGVIKKAVATFHGSNRIREVYYGPGKDYENKVMYIKDYDGVTNALDAEVYVWERKLVKSIITDPVKEDERKHPERIIDRANYELLVKVKMKQ
jgi:hypothetical protein